MRRSETAGVLAKQPVDDLIDRATVWTLRADNYDRQGLPNLAGIARTWARNYVQKARAARYSEPL
jgi:hypothetical protein